MAPSCDSIAMFRWLARSAIDGLGVVEVN